MLSRGTKNFFLYGSKSKFCVQCNQPDGKIIPSETDIEMISKTLCCSSLSLISLFWLLCNLKFFREEMFQVLITLQTLCKCSKFQKLLQTILNKINLSWKRLFFLSKGKNNNNFYNNRLPVNGTINPCNNSSYPPSLTQCSGMHCAEVDAVFLNSQEVKF